MSWGGCKLSSQAIRWIFCSRPRTSCSPPGQPDVLSEIQNIGVGCAGWESFKACSRREALLIESMKGVYITRVVQVCSQDLSVLLPVLWSFWSILSTCCLYCWVCSAVDWCKAGVHLNCCRVSSPKTKPHVRCSLLVTVLSPLPYRSAEPLPCNPTPLPCAQQVDNMPFDPFSPSLAITPDLSGQAGVVAAVVGTLLLRTQVRPGTLDGGLLYLGALFLSILYIQFSTLMELTFTVRPSHPL
jgi:hypothetical protein